MEKEEWGPLNLNKTPSPELCRLGVACDTAELVAKGIMNLWLKDEDKAREVQEVNSCDACHHAETSVGHPQVATENTGDHEGRGMEVQAALKVSAMENSLERDAVGDTTSDNDVSDATTDKVFFRRQWVAEGRMVKFRKLSRKIIFLDFCLSQTSPPDEEKASECSTSDRQTEDNSQGALVEMVLKWPLCGDVKLQAARLHLGERVTITGPYIESLHETGRQHLLFHATTVKPLLAQASTPTINPIPSGAAQQGGASPPANHSAPRGFVWDSGGKNGLVERRRAETEAWRRNFGGRARGEEEGGGEGEGDREGAGEGEGEEAFCKFWLNCRVCIHNERCPYLHPVGDALVAARTRWIAARIERRRVELKSPDDPLDPHSKSRRGARGIVFAEFLIDTFSRPLLQSGYGVLDIAGGRGNLSFALHTQSGVRTTLVDPRPRKLSRFESKFLARNPGTQLCPVISSEFDHCDPAWDDIIDGASCLVGLHPDEATEPIVRAAIAKRKPFAVVPCCVFAAKNPHRWLNRNGEKQPVESYEDLVEYLKNLCCESGGDVKVGWLKLDGKNMVLFCRAYTSAHIAHGDDYL